MKLDWEKVQKCKHENRSETYFEWGTCGTPYCSWEETRCLDCGVYICECGCGVESGFDGWPRARRRAEYRKQEAKAREIGRLRNITAGVLTNKIHVVE